MFKLGVLAFIVLACGVTKTEAARDCLIRRSKWWIKRSQVPGIKYLYHGLRVCSERRCYYYRYSELETVFGGLFVTLNNVPVCPGDNVNPWSDAPHALEHATGIETARSRRSATCGVTVDGDSCCPTNFSLQVFKGDDAKQTNIAGAKCQILELPKKKHHVQWTFKGSCHKPGQSCDVNGYCVVSQIKRIVQLLAWCPTNGLGFYSFGFGSHCICVNRGR